MMMEENSSTRSRSRSSSTSRSNGGTAAAAAAAAAQDAQFMGSTGSSTGKTSSKVGVLLLNLGGPEKLDDVQPFLYNLFADPDIIRYDNEEEEEEEEIVLVPIGGRSKRKELASFLFNVDLFVRPVMLLPLPPPSLLSLSWLDDELGVLLC